MSLRCFVARPGSPFAGTVPISLGLWTPDGPIRGDRVVFFDRPQAVLDNAEMVRRAALMDRHPSHRLAGSHHGSGAADR